MGGSVSAMGVLIPAIVAFLIWQGLVAGAKLNRLERAARNAAKATEHEDARRMLKSMVGPRYVDHVRDLGPTETRQLLVSETRDLIGRISLGGWLSVGVGFASVPLFMILMAVFGWANLSWAWLFGFAVAIFGFSEVSKSERGGVLDVLYRKFHKKNVKP